MVRTLLSEGMALKSKLSRLLVAGSEPSCRHAFETDGERSLDAAFDHPAFPLDQLQLAEPEQVLRVILALGRALPGQPGVFAVEGRQAELFEMVLEQHLRCLAHAPAPDIRLM
jgi:hypothetical protein